ncbi:MAG: hypothetical protein PUQ00_06185 [Nostoc sp. S13]|nr:hypothetical protein [Nostoc sp. S13]
MSYFASTLVHSLSPMLLNVGYFCLLRNGFLGIDFCRSDRDRFGN